MFDPYRKWLGITPNDQPPNHYRLLGIELFEKDPDIIEGAADRAMGFVRLYQSGEHAAHAAKLLNELATARLTLLKADLKADYDANLRKQLAVRTPATRQDEDEALDFDPELAKGPALPRKRRPKKQDSLPRFWIGSAIGAITCIVVLSLIPLGSSRSRPQPQSVEPAITKSEIVSPPKVAADPVAEVPVEKNIETTKQVDAETKVATKVDAEVIKSEAIRDLRPGNGDVVVLSNFNSGRCMTVFSDDHIVQGPLADQAGALERWKLVSVGDYFKLINEKRSKALAIPASSKTAGVQLIAWDDLNSEDQQWSFVKRGDHYSLVSRWSGFAVGVAYSAKTDNAGVVQWPLAGTSDQPIPDQAWRVHIVSRSNYSSD